MTKTRSHEGIVRGLAVEGDGAVPLADGTIVLARGVLPGERVRVEEISAGRVRRARRVEVLAPSKERVEPPCAYAARCGGCPLMHASAPLQRETKIDRVQRALGLPAVALESPVRQLGYRQRARLAFVRGDEGLAIGYRADASRNVVDVERCIVLGPVLDELLAVVRTRLASHLTGAGELRLGVSGDRGSLRIESRDAQPTGLYTMLESLVREGVVRGAALLAGGAGAAIFGEAFEETRDAEGRALRAPLGGFAQAHAEHNRTLANHAVERVAPEGAHVLELFAGHGNFTLSIAQRAQALTAVELDADATRCLRENLETHQLRATVITSDSASATHALPRGSVDAVLLDPPREGARDAIAPLVALAPQRIVYVSCHPESLGRDASMLVAGGYRLASARAFDMFPQTAHVEVVARFERADARDRPKRA